ncbi:MAG: glycosyltransferase [Bacteroidaceae bacterium]|nr:glycosyltransferase [Bacteroidaceae bacterium]
MRRALASRVVYATALPSVSIVVYAHAEEAEDLPNLLPALLAQKYPQFEVIVVNDGVSFEVQNAIALYECEHDNVYQTGIPDTVYNVSRKKLGITLGIKAAKNDVIVLTESNCKPVSDNWLSSIARNFVPGVDVVLGYTRMMDKSGAKQSGFQVFNRALFAMKYFSFAIMKKPYMGVGSNLAYRKEVFFANKGFSSKLNLHFGDDDLLVNEIANGRNTRIEVSPDSIVESFHEDVREAWSELRMRYNFTSKYLRTSSRTIFAIETVAYMLFWAVLIAAVAMLLPQAFVGTLSYIIALAIVFVIALLMWLLIWYVYRCVGRMLGESVKPGLAPLYLLVRPIFTFYYSMRDKRSKKSNFTWQHLR